MSTRGAAIEKRPDGFGSIRVKEGVLYVATRDFLLGTRYLAVGEIALLNPRDERVQIAIKARALKLYCEE